MKLKSPVFIVILFLISLSSSAQDGLSNDQLKFKVSIKWLENWLTYNYYNSESGVHWSNRFFYSEKNRTISLRNVSTYNPNSAKKKKVLDRTVKIDRLDAASIKLIPIEENRGRIVEGTLVEISTIGEDREIQRSFDGHKSLKEYKLEIPIPKYYEDSVLEISVNVKKNFVQMINMAARVYPSEDAVENMKNLHRVFRGSFKGSNGTVRQTNGIMPMAFESSDSLSGSFVEKEIIGYDQSKEQYYRWEITPNETRVMPLELVIGENLVLASIDEKFTLTVFGAHDFSIEKAGTRVDYHRISF